MGKKKRAGSEDLTTNNSNLSNGRGGSGGRGETRGRKPDPYLKLLPEEREEVRRRVVMELLQGLASGNLLYGRDRARDIAGVSPETEVLYYLPVQFVIAYKDLFHRALKVDGSSTLGASQDRVGKDGEEQLASGTGPETQVVSGTGIFTKGPVLKDAITNRPLIKEEYLQQMTGVGADELLDRKNFQGPQPPELTGKRKEKALEKLGLKDGEQYVYSSARPRGLRRGDTGSHQHQQKAAAGGKRHKVYTTILSGDAFERKQYVDRKLQELVGAMMGEGKFSKRQCSSSTCKQFLEPHWRFCSSCGTQVK